MLYITIFIVLLWLTYKYDFGHHTRGRKEWYVVMLIVLILVAGLRYRLGVDSIRYESHFTDWPNVIDLLSGKFDTSTTRIGIGYIFLTSIARTISDDFMVMQFIQAIYVNCLVFWFFKNNTQNIFFAVLIYFTFLYLNFMCEVMREACAAATLLWAWKYFVNQKWIKYYVLALVCILFHPSGFISFALPILYLPAIRPFFVIGKRTIYILLGFFIAGTIISVSLIDYIAALTFIDSVQESAQLYVNSKLSGNILNLNGMIGTLLRYVIYPLTAVMILRRRKQRNDNYATALELMVSMCLIVAVLSLPIALFYRYNNYFFPFAIIAICDCAFKPIPIKGILTKLKFSMWLIVFIPFFFIQIYGLFSTVPQSNLREYMRYYPYSSRIDMQKDVNREAIFYHYRAF